MVALLTRGAWFAVLALASPAVAEPPQPVALKIASGFPRGFRAFDSLDAAARAITAKSEGRVRIELSGDAKIGNDDLPAVLDGSLDGAVVPTALLGSLAPTAAVFALPLAFSSLDEAAFVATRLDATVASELEDDGLTLVAGAGMGFAYLTSRLPIHRPEDFTGKRLWTPKQSGSPFDFAATGAIAVPLGFDEVEAALVAATQADPSVPAVDCVIGLPDLAILKQWHRHLAFVLDLPLFLVDFRMVARRESLARLTAADRALFDREFAAAFAAIDADRRAKAKAFRRVFERAGATLHVPTGDERAAWDSWRERLTAEFAEKRSIPAPSLAMLKSAREEFAAKK